MCVCLLRVLIFFCSNLSQEKLDREIEKGEGATERRRNGRCLRVGDVGIGALAGVLMCGGRVVGGGGWLGSITQHCDADACGHSLQSSPVNQESFRAQTLLSLHKRQDHNNR